MDEFELLIKILIYLPLTIMLIYLVLKYGGGKLEKLHSGRNMKIIERLPLSKENSLFLVKLGEDFHIISSTNGKVEILKDLNKEDIVINRENNLNSQSIQTILTKLKNKKEGNDEE